MSVQFSSVALLSARLDYAESRNGALGEGVASPCLPGRVWGSAVSSPSEVRRGVPAANIVLVMKKFIKGYF